MSDQRKSNLLLCGLIFVIIVVYFAFGRKGTNPASVTSTRLRALEVEVMDWAKNNGSPPLRLSDLGLAEDSITDHMGNPFSYQVDGSRVTIKSLGADGKPGGTMFKADHQVTFDCHP